LLGCECDHDHSYKLAAGDDDLAKELAKTVEDVWKKKGMPKPRKKITAYYGQHLSKALEEGYGKKIGEIDYDTPDGNMLAHLVENTYSFAAAKNYTQLRQLTQALVEDGKLRTYSQFKKAAFEINDTHVNQWLKAEYELAVAGSQMASKWVDITENAGTKILEFDAVLDSKTSDGCRLLNGVRKPVDDPFWNAYYPPNHFNCRSTVRQHFEGSTTPDHSITYPDDKKVPPMFRVNLAKQKLAFPPGHAYWAGTPASVIKEALDMAPINSWLPVENNTIRIHKRVNAEADDFEVNIEIARDFAARRFAVDILPTLKENDPLYAIVFKNAPYKPTCPDLLVGKKTFIEVKEPTKNRIRTIKGRITDGSHQANYVVVKVPGKIQDINLMRIARGRFKDHRKLEVIEFKVEEKYYRYDRKDVLK
jgi:SPP1 gp7 family putative phage head morphogenesis protein